MSTASFKDFGWGITGLYWAQAFRDAKYAFVAGQMDPGDFQDLHPLLSAWVAFMNDASFNNPTVALPQQGLGIVGRVFFSDHVYMMAGLNDANGTPSKLDFESFFEVREYHTWVEAGWSPSPKREMTGDSIHLTVWRSDPRVAEGIDKSWGIALSGTQPVGDRWIPFVRAGYSEGGAGLMRRMITGGVGMRVKSADLLGVAVTWGSPPLGEGPDPFTTEVLYRFNLTDNIRVTPGVHWTTFKGPNRSDHLARRRTSTARAQSAA